MKSIVPVTEFIPTQFFQAWDTELEHLALIHAKKCTTQKDKCRNTGKQTDYDNHSDLTVKLTTISDRFVNVGQNINILFFELDEDLDNCYKSAIDSWCVLGRRRSYRSNTTSEEG